ncbi:phosphoribosyltransferase [Ramlibacter sp.]|uniref:phosphoribosyltransferase n=1 Tax=Ramlibacter sp. TaxID=1917967 RepID=UPI002C9D1991|nr:phosphoribosyltransferase family protein [Ramlibacter sp.]HWI81184.1 phosphoribosyltransferase family protein [Ramlibacter sp.]
MTVPFSDRSAAGRALAGRLQGYAGRDDVVVMALLRGGVPVAAEVARALRAPLELLIVRKLLAPGRPELPLGALAGGGAMYVDPQAIAEAGVAPAQLEGIVAAESVELIRRHAMYSAMPTVVPEGRTVIVVDDCLVTGASMCAALKTLRSAKPAWVVAAVPVGPCDSEDRIGTVADEFVSVLNPTDFANAGRYYGDFTPVTDEEVRQLLARRGGEPPPAA